MQTLKLDEKIQIIEDMVNLIMNAKRCPKCSQRALELVTSGYIPTGIFECVNAQCPVRTFDPTMPEAI